MKAGLQFAFVFATTALVACDQGTKPRTSDPEPSAADQRKPLIIVTERTPTSDESTTRTVERFMEFKHAMCACKNAACAERVFQALKKIGRAEAISYF